LQLLIARGANINATDNDGVTPLDLARKFRNADCVELLLENHAIGMLAECIHKQSRAEMVRLCLLFYLHLS
jgi:ankyrin repeat protein